MTRSRAAMRQALLGLLGEMPFEAVTGAMVAERAEIGYATYFRHYADPRDLLVDTVAHLADSLVQRMMPALLATQSHEAARLLVNAVEADRASYIALLGGAGDATRGMLARILSERLEALPDLSPPWLPHRLAVRFAIVGTVEILDWWLREEPELDPQEIATIIERLILAQINASHTRD